MSSFQAAMTRGSSPTAADCRRRHLAFCLVLMAGLMSAAINAAASPAAIDTEEGWSRPTYQIPRTTTAIDIDGLLDDEIWQHALTVDLPYETSPGDNTPAPVFTECYLAYDESSLYVAFRAGDGEPSRIQARLTDRDNIWHDDRVGIMIDPFNDERRGFEFLVNPLGVQMDAARNDVGGDNERDVSWDAIWDSAGRIDAEGYTVEMAIPFNSLRFPRTQDEQTWGFAAARQYPRNVRYEMMSVPNDRDATCFFCQTGKLAGFVGISPGRNIEFAPTFTASRNDQPAVAGGSLQDGEAEEDVGLSARWGITPNVSLNATFNPDFSQVEADVAQLSVNERFALFFPEKRPFFMEGADFFQTPFQVLHTRTVVDPSWGFKTSGKEAGNGFGAFVASDEAANLLIPSNQSSRFGVADGDVTTGVIRYRRDVGEASTLGVIATAREGDDYYNRVYGADGFLRLTSTKTARFQLLGSATSYPTAVADAYGQTAETMDGFAGRMNLAHDSRHWRLWGNYEDLDENFRADAGFVPRVDARTYRGGFQRRFWGQGDGWYTWLGMGVEGSRIEDHGGKLTDENVALVTHYNGPWQSYLNLRLVKANSYYNGDMYDNDRVFFTTNFIPTDDLRFWCAGSIGNAIDFANSQPAWRVWGGPGIEYRFGKHVSLFLDHSYEELSVHSKRLFVANLINMNLDYQFTSRMRARAVLQYLDVSRDTDLFAATVNEDDNDLFSQLLFSYKVNPQTLLYLGYSDDRYGDEGAQTMRQVDRTLFFKVGYAWTQ